MAHPLDTMLRSYVTPVLKEAGYTKAGRIYRLAAKNGDYAIFDLYTTENVASDKIGFGARFGIAPRTMVAWHRRDAGDPFDRPPGIENELLIIELIPPEESSYPLSYEQMFGSNWRLDAADEGRACGEALRAAVINTVPLIRSLLDRNALLAEIRKPTLRSIAQPELNTDHPCVWARLGIQPREAAEIIVLLEDGPLAEIQDLLPAAERPFGTWDWARRNEQRCEVGFSGSYVVCRSEVTLYDLVSVNERTEGLEWHDRRSDGWQVGQYQGTDIERDARAMLTELTAETGQPCLTAFVLDSDAAIIEGFSQPAGYWRSCLARESMAAYADEVGEDFADYLEPAAATRRALAWSMDAALQPAPKLLRRLFELEHVTLFVEPAFFELLAALGVPA
jgi:hypothetical protein